MSNAYRDRLLSVGYLSKGRTRAREKSGREHPESGKPYKKTLDELGNVVTEHGQPGTGVSDRQDAHVYIKEPIVCEVEL